eukprot:GHVO01046662.1.p1 GENE.GHVO01046662.1~~GHVO01046662.1.p1  ORF type:complete len:207 (-),score=29.26 GHVO01046662.1:164-784(-)
MEFKLQIPVVCAAAIIVVPLGDQSKFHEAADLTAFESGHDSGELSAQKSHNGPCKSPSWFLGKKAHLQRRRLTTIGIVTKPKRRSAYFVDDYTYDYGSSTSRSGVQSRARKHLSFPQESMAESGNVEGSGELPEGAGEEAAPADVLVGFSALAGLRGWQGSLAGAENGGDENADENAEAKVEGAPAPVPDQSGSNGSDGASTSSAD